MKRLFAIVTTLCLVCSLFMCVTYADDNINILSSDYTIKEIDIDNLIGTTQSVTISEYDILKELQAESTNELLDNGYTKEEIHQIKAPLKAQEKYGNVTYSINYTKMYNKNGNTYLTTEAKWSWSKQPAVLLTDVISMTTSSGFIKDSGSTTVQYYNNLKKQTIKAHPTVKTNGAGTGVYSRITMAKNYDSDAKCYKNIALSGKMTTNWVISGKYSITGIAAKYGHTVVACTPSASFSSGSTAISFTPKFNCKGGAEAYKRATVQN